VTSAAGPERLPAVHFGALIANWSHRATKGVLDLEAVGFYDDVTLRMRVPNGNGLPGTAWDFPMRTSEVSSASWFTPFPLGHDVLVVP
jgi:hypothetical protein